MCGIRGKAISPATLQRIVSLLSTTDLSMRLIASRMNCHFVTVSTINRKLKIRVNRGRGFGCQTS